jgi:hypothetical protein
MQEFGRVSLARRLADMSERGIMEVIRDGDEFRIRMCEDSRAQFADATEFDRLKAAEVRIHSSSAGWTMASMRATTRFPDIPGNYLALVDAPVRSVLLFAISRSSVRTQGYGIKTHAPSLAMAVWPQFVRARMEIGPSERSMRDVHARLLEEHGQLPDVLPMPASIRVAGATLHIHDLWNRTDSATSLVQT